jgi:proteic killer suppression protein
MEVSFRNRRVARTFSSEVRLRRDFGERMARAIMIRMAVLIAAEALSLVPTTKPIRRHQLKGDRDDHFAVDLVHPYRLVFEPDHDPIPRLEDGGINLEAVSAIRILEVIDYH